jgi:hypothetical protein
MSGIAYHPVKNALENMLLRKQKLLQKKWSLFTAED